MKQIREQLAEDLKNAEEAIQKVKAGVDAVVRAAKNADGLADSWTAKIMASEYTVAFIAGGFFAAMMVGVFIGMQIN